MKCVKNCWKKIKSCFFARAIFQILACLAVLIFIFCFLYFKLPWSSFEIIADYKLQEFHDIMIVLITLALVLVTFALAMIARTQLIRATEVNKANFLHQIMQKYTSGNIVQARVIIHKLYLRTKGQTESEKRRQIRTQITKMSKNDKDAEEYIILLNLLDFLETISYFANNNGGILQNELKDLVGNSIEFYYDIYKDWIEQRREKYQKENFYVEFEMLVRKMKSGHDQSQDK